MKTKFNNIETCHVWAQRPWGNGGTAYGEGSSIFFHREKIYSYGKHYELARFLDQDAVLINDRGYSVTTAKHIRYVTQATTHKQQYFESKVNVSLVYNKVRELLKKTAKARKPEIYIRQINNLLASFFKFHDTRFSDIDKRKAEYRFLKSVKENGPAYFVPSVKLDIEREKRHQEREKQREANAHKVATLKFMNYEIHGLYNYNFPDVIRVSKCGDFVETGRGVKVSKQEAAILYRMIKAGKNVRGYKIDHYTVTSINGTLKIGCHNIDMDCVKKVGEQIINN